MPDIESLLKEKRVFKPEKDFSRTATWSKKQVAEYRKLGEKSPERLVTSTNRLEPRMIARTAQSMPGM